MATDPEQSDDRRGGLSTPLVAGLLGFLAAAALAVPLTLQVNRAHSLPARDPAEWVHGPIPVCEDAGFAPPAGCGAGRLILSACGKTGRKYAIYLPSDYYPALPGRFNKARSYPLVIWLSSGPIDREAANELARTWGPAADRDRYMVLMPELTGEIWRDTKDLFSIIAHVRHWWLVTDGPIHVGSTSDSELLADELNALWMRCSGPPFPIPKWCGEFFRIEEPADFPAIPFDNPRWNPLRISYSIDACQNGLSILYLTPVVAARLGRIVEYKWDCRELGWPQPTKLFKPDMVIQHPGTFNVGLTIKDEAGQTFSCTRKIVVPPANKATPPSCLPGE